MYHLYRPPHLALIADRWWVWLESKAKVHKILSLDCWPPSQKDLGSRLQATMQMFMICKHANVQQPCIDWNQWELILSMQVINPVGCWMEVIADCFWIEWYFLSSSYGISNRDEITFVKRLRREEKFSKHWFWANIVMSYIQTYFLAPVHFAHENINTCIILR